MKILAAVLAILVGAWLVFDGVRALTVGDYVTPSSGTHAGQLGPWSKLFETVGIDPRSTLVKAIHVGTGVALLLGSTLLLARTDRAAFVVCCALGLWYLPFGTLLLGIAIAVTLIVARRAT